MKIQGRESTINQDGTLSITNDAGNLVVITGTVFGTKVVIENIESAGSGYKVTANGMTLDIVSSDADKVISFVDTGSPDSIKRKNGSFIEPSVKLYKIREINADTNEETTFEQPTSSSEGLSTGKKILLIGAIAGVVYFAYRKLRVR